MVLGGCTAAAARETHPGWAMLGSAIDRLEAIYREHGAAVLDYLRRHFRGVETGEDLLQETLVQALERPERLAESSSPRAWLFGIARHVGLSAARRRRPMAPLESDPPASAPASPSDAVEAMRAALAELPAAQREVLELRLRGELSYDEIAEVLSVPVGTVRSRLHSAVQALRDRLVAGEVDRAVGASRDGAGVRRMRS